MKKQIILFLLASLIAQVAYTKEDKNAQKNNKIVEKEERNYQKKLDKDTSNAKIYWDHANNLVAIASEFRRAGEFYDLALKKDSADAGIYRDYGKYLYQIMDIDSAKSILTKGLTIASNDIEMKKYLGSVNKAIEAREIETKMNDFGLATTRELGKDINYIKRSNFDSLKRLIADSVGGYNYQNLLKRFLADDNTLTPEEMYFMIIGYSTQKSYNAFHYNDVLELKMLASHNIDSAIAAGNEIAKTNPLNPTLNRELMYFCRKKNDPVTAEKYLNRVHKFFNGVLFSGDGTCEKPYISLWGKEEYSFIAYLGYKATDDHSMGICAGQMSEQILSINNTTQKKENINFNLRLIYLQSVGK